MVRKRLLAWVACGFCILSVSSGLVMGQQRGGGRGPQTRARFELATLTEVQADLKLNEDQKKLAKDLLAKQREKRQSFTQGGDFQAMRAEMAKINTEFDTEFMAKLDEKQNARMHGLIAQVNGAAALIDPAIAKALGVTDEQLKKLKATNDANLAARREAMSGFQDLSQEQRQEAMTKLADKESKLLLADAGDELKKKLEDLKGTPLTIDQAPLRPARPGN
jgi:hypothetical protein